MSKPNENWVDGITYFGLYNDAKEQLMSGILNDPLMQTPTPNRRRPIWRGWLQQLREWASDDGWEINDQHPSVTITWSTRSTPD